MQVASCYVKLLRSGQITLPKKLRDFFGANFFEATLFKDEGIILKPVHTNQKEQSPEEIRDLLKVSGKYKKEFINDIYESLHEEEEGKSKVLKGTLIDLAA